MSAWALPPSRRTNSAAARCTLALNPPHNPRSDVTTTTSVLPSSRGVNRGWAVGGTRASTCVTRWCRRSANGRAAMTRSWARCSLAADTIFMALVICCVFLTLAIRRRISRRLGILGSLHLLGRKAGFALLNGPPQRLIGLGVDFPGVQNGARNLRIARVGILGELALKRPDGLDGLIVQIPVDAGRDGHDLLGDAARLILVLLEQLHHALP